MCMTEWDSKTFLPAMKQMRQMTALPMSIGSGSDLCQSFLCFHSIKPCLIEGFFSGCLNSYFTNDPNFNQWPINETLHFTKVFECTINKTYKMSCPWKHEIQHAGMCLILKIKFRNKMFQGPQKEARSNFKKKHKSFLPHK